MCHGNLRIYRWIPNRFEYLKACDLVISRAGHGTITQCMCYGKPMILIPTPSHTEQLNNAKQAQRLGVAKMIEQEKLSRERLLENVQEILEGEIPKRLEITQREALKHNGLENATRIIIEAAEKEDHIFN